MRKVTKLNNQIKELQRELQETRKQGTIAAVACGGLTVVTAIGASIANHTRKGEIDSLCDGIQTIIDHFPEGLCSCSCESENESEEDEESSSEEKTDSDVNPPEEVTSQGDELEMFKEFLTSMDFEEGEPLRVKIEVIDYLVKLSFGETAKFSHKEPTTLVDGFLVGDKTIDFIVFLKDKKLTVSVGRGKKADIQQL